MASCCWLTSAYSQTDDDIRQWAGDVASAYAEALEVEDLSLWMEDLLSLTRNPVNINVAGRQDLERIFFLSDIQIENILFKRYVNGLFLSVYELQTVEGLALETIKLLEPVIYFGEGEADVPPFRIWGDSFFRSEYQLEQADGFLKDDEGYSAFRGDPFKLYSRTELLTNRGFSAGLIAEKDPGEPVFDEQIKGMDLMTGYVHFENADGWLREAGVGQYRVSAGQGLVLQSGMPGRKSAMTTRIRNRRPSLRPSLSASESSGMRGGYLTLACGSVEFSPFVSFQKKDGRTDSDGCLTSLRDDGWHRTELEIEQRKNVEELIMGGKVSFSGRWFSIEAGHLIYQLDQPLCPSEHPYNQFYFRGKQVENSFFSYMLSKRKLLIFGEFAMDGFRRPAVWNGLLWGAAPGFSIALGHRCIAVDYRAPLAGPMTESSSFSGEQGFYTGVRWELPYGILVSSYFDYYRFKWLKYRVNAPSAGFDYLGQTEKKLKGGTSVSLRYRHRERPVNRDVGVLEDIIDHDIYDQIKIQYREKNVPGWQFTTQAQWHFVNSGEQKENGRMLAQDIKWNSRNEKLTFTGRYAVFSSTGYLARLYAYEPHVLYMFSVPAYSGNGSRYFLLMNYKITGYLHLWLRAARWHYNDRNTLGTGNNQVDANVKTTFTAQIRFKF